MPRPPALTLGPVAAFALATRVPGLGELTPGVSSDVVVFDPARDGKSIQRRSPRKGRTHPRVAMELIGKVRVVVVGGELAFEEEAVAHV